MKKNRYEDERRRTRKDICYWRSRSLHLYFISQFYDPVDEVPGIVVLIKKIGTSERSASDKKKNKKKIFVDAHVLNLSFISQFSWWSTRYRFTYKNMYEWKIGIKHNKKEQVLRPSLRSTRYVQVRVKDHQSSCHPRHFPFPSISLIPPLSTLRLRG